MDTVFLNGHFIDQHKASIPIMDRGILFGDGVYEVIPAIDGKLLGFELHLQRLHRSLRETGMENLYNAEYWKAICERLLSDNGDNSPVYIQVTRGLVHKRSLGYSDGEQTTIAFSLDPDLTRIAQEAEVGGYKIITGKDIRWGRCDIKTTSMLANVMTFESRNRRENVDEVIMYDDEGHITEGCAVNVFFVHGNTISTPPLSNKILPGITRKILLNILTEHSHYKVEERNISLAQLKRADEIMISSSTKSVAPVTEVDGAKVGDGSPGSVWKGVKELFHEHKWEY